jgi:MFS family permease
MGERRYVAGVPRRGPVLVFALLSQWSCSLIQFGLPALYFALRDEFGIGPAEFGLTFGAIGVGSGLSLAVAGRLCDRVGARPVLTAGAILSAGGLCAAAFAPSTAVLTMALFVAGIGCAAPPVAGMTTLLRTFPPEQRGQVMGLRQMSVPAGGVTAAGLLPTLYHLGGLELAFVVPALLVLASGLGFAVVSGPGQRVTHPASKGWSLPPGLPRLLLVGGLYVSALGGVLAFTAASAEDAGLSVTEAAIVFAFLNVGAGVARVVWGRVADRETGTRRVRTLVEIGLVGTVAALAFPLLVHAGPVAAAAGALVLAFGALGFNGVVYLIAGELGGVHRAGAAVGLASTVVFSVGSLVGPLYGLLVEHAGYEAMYAVIAACTLAGAVVARGLAAPVRAAHVAPVS